MATLAMRRLKMAEPSNDWSGLPESIRPWVPLILAFGAGFLLPLLERWNNWRKDRAAARAALLVHEATVDKDLRTDLRETEKYLRDQLRSLETANATLRLQNGELIIQNAQIQAQNVKLTSEVAELKGDNAALLAQVGALLARVEALEQARPTN